MRYIRTFESYEDDDFDKSFTKALKRGIPTEEFWNFVDLVKWKESSNYHTKYLLDNISHIYTWDDMMEFEKIYNNLYKFLDNKLREVWLGDPGINVSDDGYSDLLSSIIGYGEEFFKSIINDTTFNKVREMADDYDYRENFGYIFSSSLPSIGEEKWDEIH